MKRLFAKKDSVLSKRTKGELALYIAIFVVFLIYAISLIYPVIWLTINSLKYFVDYRMDNLAGKPFAFPKKWYWQNYREAFLLMEYEGTNFIGMFFHSLWQSILSILVGTLVSAAFSYTVAKFRFPGKDFLYGLVITVMVMPIMTGSGSTFKLYHNLGLYNNPLLVIVSSLGWGNFLYFYAFFRSVSNSYAEAVYIDGGGEFTAFFKIVLPQATPIMFALGIMSFIAKWNDYMSVLLYLPAFPTIASGMYLIKNTLLRTGKDPIYFAGTVLSIIPVMALFIAFSDTLMENMSIGGLKG